ncbi:hypothetical protein [uncultured Pontibacter sp.]|uniref:hypothetical protein n=1 Tax=uncultured Pontibacter sp. TaxID=453356 RepID=UPI0026167648|nr:hypothetical protein [uncultured Pontibacter sp.]
MRYLLKYGAALSFLALTLSSCREEPTYPNEPEIEFNRVEQFHFEEFGIKRDSLVLVIGYQDGDGNLGLSRTGETDKQPPFNPGSPYFNNFITELFIKKPVAIGSSDSVFVKYVFPVEGFDFSGRFPRLSPDERIEPLEGEIKYSLNITSDLFREGEIVKFNIFIYDRTTPTPNKSNIIETRPIKLFTK